MTPFIMRTSLQLQISNPSKGKHVHIHIDTFCRSSIGHTTNGYETCQDKNFIYIYIYIYIYTHEYIPLDNTRNTLYKNWLKTII